MKTLTSVKACILASYLLSSAMPAHAIDTAVVTTTLQKFASVKGITTLAIAASLFQFFARKPDNNPVRYDLEKMKAGDIDFDGIKFLIIDGLIGHPQKSATIKADTNGKIEVKQGAEAKGLYGAISEIIKPLATTLGFIVVWNKFLADSNAGIDAWSNVNF